MGREMTRSEEEYYPIVEKFLIEQKRCVTRSNVRRSSVQMDVYGVRDSTRRNDESEFENIEVFGVEVKIEKVVAGIRQARDYKKFCHWIYLAAPLKIDEKDAIELVANGIGFLEISDEDEVKERFTGQKSFPPQKNIEDLLHHVDVLRCSFCNFHYKGSNMIIFEDRESSEKNRLQLDAKRNFGNKKYVFYICPNCKEIIKKISSELLDTG